MRICILILISLAIQTVLTLHDKTCNTPSKYDWAREQLKIQAERLEKYLASEREAEEAMFNVIIEQVNIENSRGFIFISSKSMISEDLIKRCLKERGLALTYRPSTWYEYKFHFEIPSEEPAITD